MSKDIDIKSHKGNYQVYFNEFAIEDLNNNIPDNAHFIVDKNVAKIYKDKINNVLNKKNSNK